MYRDARSRSRNPGDPGAVEAPFLAGSPSPDDSAAGSLGVTAAVLTVTSQLLEEYGWCQGRTASRLGRLSLDGAVDLAVNQCVSGQRERMVTRARVRNCLCRAAGAGALAAWNDDERRRLADVSELLQLALKYHAA